MKKKIIISMIAIVLMVVGTQVNASTIETTGKQFKVRTFIPENDEYVYSSWVNTNNTINTSSGNGIVDAVRMKFVYTDYFNPTTDYLVHMRVETSPLVGNNPLRSILCHGITNTSTWNENQDYITTCELSNISVTSTYTEYQIHIKPQRNINGLQVTTYYKDYQYLDSVKVLTSSYVETITSQSQIVNNQTNTIVNNQNQNTQDIINNQNQNTQDQINSQKVCKQYDKTSIKVEKKYLNASGNLTNTQLYGITDYINVYNSTIKEIVHLDTTSQSSMCFYNVNKTLISCLRNNNISGNITLPPDTYYVRLSINTDEDKPQFEICSNGNQAINDSINNLNDTLNQDAEYNNNPSETIQGQDKINEMEQTESQIFNSLDFSGVEDLDITIEPNSASFIWEIVNRLRQLSSKIVLLMTSILGLGIIKMILNR